MLVEPRHAVTTTGTCLLNKAHYRPQRSCGKIMFLHLFVILFRGGGVWQTPSSQTPPGQTPPWQTPPRQTPPSGQTSPPSGQTPPPLWTHPWGRHPLGRLPSSGRHPRADTDTSPPPPGRHPPGQTSLLRQTPPGRHCPPRQTPPWADIPPQADTRRQTATLPHPGRRLLHRTVRILTECILIYTERTRKFSLLFLILFSHSFCLFHTTQAAFIYRAKPSFIGPHYLPKFWDKKPKVTTKVTPTNHQ